MADIGIVPVKDFLSFTQEGPEEIRSISIRFNSEALDIFPNMAKLPDVLIIHQGILDKIDWPSSTPYREKKLAELVDELKIKIPMVVITSGRSEPQDLPPNAKFIGFSILENYILSSPASKFLFVSTIMKLSKGKANGNVK